MRIRFGFLFLFLTLANPHSQASPPPTGYRISGIVVDSQTSQPLDHAEVSISSVLDQKETHSFLTSSDGRFLFSNLPPGKYRLTASRSGYVAQAFREHETYSTAIATGPGKDSENLRFPLPRSAAITGVVTDEWNDPVREAQVTLFAYGFSGGSRKAHVFTQAGTNDLGRYRFANLPPGTYSVMVSAQPWYVEGSNFERSSGLLQSVDSSVASDPSPAADTQFDVVYPITYFPNAATLAEANKLTLAPGDSQTADIALHPVPSIHILVKTPDLPPSGQEQQEPEETVAAPGFAIDVARRVGDDFSQHDSINLKQVTPGQIEVSGLQPGEVILSANAERTPGFSISSQPLTLSASSDIDLNPHGAFAEVSGVALNGNVPKNQSSPPSAPAIAKDAEDADTEAGGPLVFRATNTGASYSVNISGNGEFSFGTNVLPAGTYEVSFQNFPNMRVQSISAKGAIVSGHTTVEIPSGQPVKLTIHTVVADATVTGVALKNSKPVAGAMLLLVPQDPDQNAALFHRDQSDSDGTFTMSPIFPGRYTLLAIENGWDLEWANPAVLFRYFPSGISVDVTPSATITLNPKVQ